MILIKEKSIKEDKEERISEVGGRNNHNKRLNLHYEKKGHDAKHG